ncbi:MAG: Sca4 family protein [Candidatus Rickettsia vulgarisii]
MSKNPTEEQKIENEKLASALSEHINNSSYSIPKNEIAHAMGISPEALQYDDKGVKISAEQIANLGEEKRNEIKNLYDLDEGFYDMIAGEKDKLISNLIKIQNENERLADVVSNYINSLDFPPSIDELAEAFNIDSAALQYDSEGKLKISVDQVANLDGKGWNSIRDLAQGYDEGTFEEFFNIEDSVMNKLAKYNESEPIYENISDHVQPKQPTQVQPDNEQEAGDTVFQGSSSIAIVKDSPSITISPNANAANLDPITEAIRREILAKQREKIVNYLIEQGQDQQKKKDLIDRNLVDPKAYSAYAKDEENQEKIREALKNEQLKKSLEGIEVAGYKNVHEQFKNEFSPIKWDSFPAGVGAAPNITTRTQIVKNAAGEEIATLTESTHQITPPVAVKDSAGKVVELKNYRTIDFPIKLEEGKNGPMHLSMAVKDQNGKNIALSKAVYFTAHYDDSGELTEVSSTKPVMFSGNSDDAIGYIEHQGQIYTLPVTRGKYQEMMRALGREEEIGLSKSIDALERAKDIAIVKTGSAIEDLKTSEDKEKDPKEERQSYIQQQVDLKLQEQKKYTPDEFEKATDKERFLKDLLESDLSTADKSKYLSNIAKTHPKQVMAALVSSKLGDNDKQDIAGSLLRDATDFDRIKMIEELGKNDEGRKLIINAFEKGSSKDRYDISNAIAESSVNRKTDLTKQVILAIERTGQESTVSDLSKTGREGESLVKEVAETASEVSVESAAKTVETKPEEPKKGEEKRKDDLEQQKVEESYVTKVDHMIDSFTNQSSIDVPKAKKAKSDKEISDMVKPFFEELNSKELKDQKELINTKLEELSKGENALSNADKVRFLKKLNVMEADKRSKRIGQIEEGKIIADKKDQTVNVKTIERITDAQGFPTKEFGQLFKDKKEVVGRAGSIGLQVHINNKINELAPKPQIKPKEKEGFPLGRSGTKI